MLKKKLFRNSGVYIVKQILKRHTSFIVLLASSLLFFILNIILKEKLSPEDYGNYALLLTSISVASSLGLFSLEQLILRFSVIEKNRYFYINRNIFISFFISSLLFMTLFVAVGTYYFSVNILSLIFLALGPMLLMLLYNIYRLLKQYTYSQIILNSWKFILFFYIVYSWNEPICFLQIMNIFIACFIFLTLSYIALFFKKYKIKLYDNKQEKIYLMQLNFFISMLIMTILGVGDRFIVEYYLDIKVLGEYFYYITVVLFPYVLFQSYFGFRELPQFRENFSVKRMNNKIFHAMIFGFFLSIVIGVFLLFFNNLNMQSIEKLKVENYYLIFILMLTGMVKIVYSILSAAVGATSNNKTIKQLNFYSIIAIMGVVCLFLFLNIKSIESIAFLFFAIWLVRSLLYYYKGFENVV